MTRKAIGLGLLAFGGFIITRAMMQSTPTASATDVLSVQANLIGAQIMGTPAANMALSPAGLQAIADREGFSPYSYPDKNGRSIGYGHFIQSGESFNEPMSRATAYGLLTSDSKIAADAVRAYVNVALTQNQFDALTSFVYNIGVGQFKRSTLLQRLNAGDYAGAASAFDMWHIPSTVIARRNSEKAQFLA